MNAWVTGQLMKLAFASALAPKRTLVKLALALALCIGAWAYAAWATGYTQGRGWRGAVIEGRCTITCR